MRTPVFIVGAPRSGTTFLQVALNLHPDLAMWSGETAYFRRVYDRRRAFGDPGDSRNRERIVQAYLELASFPKSGFSRVDLRLLRERMMTGGVSWRDLFASMLQAHADSVGKPHYGEKTPNHALNVATLAEWFPDCTILHLVRDPRAVVCSLMQMPWATRSVLMEARKWSWFNRAAAAVSARHNYLRVKYEDLVTRPEDQLRRICRHIGLPYDEAVLRPGPAEFPVEPSHRRAFEPVTIERLASWRAQLKPWQVSVIEATAGRQMDEFRYPRQSSAATASDLARATAEALAETALQKICRVPSALYHYLQPTNLAAEEKWIWRGAALYGHLRLRRQPRVM